MEGDLIRSDGLYDPNDLDNNNWLTFGLYDIDASAHFMALGTTGSGKTIVMRMLMQSVLPTIGLGYGVRAIVYDAKCDVMSTLATFCDPELICNFNPFDERGVAWDLCRDITEPRMATQMARILVPEIQESQPYFSSACRDILDGIMVSFMLSGIDWSLADVLRAASSKSLALRVIKKHAESEMMLANYFRARQGSTSDVFSTLSSKLMPFRSVAACWEAAKHRQSLTEFFKGEGVVVLGNSEESRTPINAVNRMLFKRATELLLGKPEYTPERTWFFIDELTEAGRLDGMVSLLKKGRTKGARVAIAFQTISGMRSSSNFGREQTDEIVGLIGNRFFGRIECPESAEYASKVFGEAEIIQKSTSYTSGGQGPTTTNSFNNIVTRVVLPSEFMSIPICNLENGLLGFVSISNHGCSRIDIPPGELFNGWLLPPDRTVPDFLPRDSIHQFLKPWTSEQESVFAPKLKASKKRTKKSNATTALPPRRKSNNTKRNAKPMDVEQNLDDLLD
jgi:type IV secretory pathway TraG/TraD family ATPase VirD4